jgi:hypothetical protein
VLFSGFQYPSIGAIAIVSALASFAPGAYGAILVPGSDLKFTGGSVIGVTSFTFQCNQPGDPACVAPPAGTGDFGVANSILSFAQYNGTFGLVKNVNNAVQPLNTAFSLPNWVTFDLNNQLTLELTFIALGSDPISGTCAGLTHCTPQSAALITPNNPQGLSGFNLDQISSGTTATFGVFGIAHASDSSSASFSGTLSSTFTGLTPQQALTVMLGGSPQTYQADLTLAGAAPVPEPVTIWLMGVGLPALFGRGFWVRRRA